MKHICKEKQPNRTFKFDAASKQKSCGLFIFNNRWKK